MFDYPIEIKYTSRKNSVGIKVINNLVTILAPKRTSERYIIKLLRKKDGWIRKHLAEKKQSKLEINQLYIFGKKLEIRKEKANQNSFIYENNELVLRYKENLDHNKILFLLNTLLINQAKSYIPDRVIKLSKETNLLPNKIILKNTKSQWGSCSRTKNISLSHNLITAPIETIDYVIIHELCHLSEMNHSRNFWNLVAQHCPAYKTHVKWLKTHNYLLTLQEHLSLKI